MKDYIRWLSYESKPDIYNSQKQNKNTVDYLSRREISMTLPGDIYIRYQTIEYEDSNDEHTTLDHKLEAQVELFKQMLAKKQPIKIDIGAVYNNCPKYKSSRHKDHEAKGAYCIPKEKEICFDIDMTDYDPVRRCCSGADICLKCWPLMKVAAKIIKQELARTFGLTQLLFVYSGRRGIHCWVCDREAREFSGPVRTALASYLDILKGSGSNNKTSSSANNFACEKKAINLYGSVYKTTAIYPESVKIIDQYFEQYLLDQEFFKEENYLLITGLITGQDRFRKYVENQLKSINPGLSENEQKDRIKFFTRQVFSNKYDSKNWTGIGAETGDKILAEIKLQLMFPRLDFNVSKDLNHLLKSPFSVHPKTDNICVPFEDFDGFKGDGNHRLKNKTKHFFSQIDFYFKRKLRQDRMQLTGLLS